MSAIVCLSVVISEANAENTCRGCTGAGVSGHQHSGRAGSPHGPRALGGCQVYIMRSYTRQEVQRITAVM